VDRPGASGVGAVVLILRGLEDPRGTLPVGSDGTVTSIWTRGGGRQNLPSEVNRRLPPHTATSPCGVAARRNGDIAIALRPRFGMGLSAARVRAVHVAESRTGLRRHRALVPSHK